MMLLVGAFLVRMVHLLSAVKNPATYHLGPDEDHYLQFARFTGDSSEVFGFMDPLYGIVLSVVLRITGDNAFAVYFLQVLVDTATVALIYGIGLRLWDRRAGLIAGALYAICAPAIFYTATLLKSTLVAHYVAAWVLLSIVAWRSEKMTPWLFLGVLSGAGIALRANLVLLAGAALLWGPISKGSSWSQRDSRLRFSAVACGCFCPSYFLPAEIMT